MSIASKCGTILIKGAGLATIGLIARDAHYYGKIKAKSDMITKDSKADQYFYYNTMTSDNPSKTVTNMQNGIYRFHLGNGIRGFFNSGIGYFKGLFSSLTSNVVPFGLGLLALLSKSKKVAKGSIVGLAVIAGYNLIRNGLGIGKTRGV